MIAFNRLINNMPPHLGLSALVLLFVVVCCISPSSVTTIKAGNPKIGSKLSADGHVINETTIYTDAKTIYFEFFLDIPNKREILLDFRWYYDNKLINQYSNRHTRGFTIVTLERIPTVTPKFSVGEYRIEVWFLNTLIVSDTFNIQE